MRNEPKIVIVGAGCIGCFVGGLLKHAGKNVSFLGRKRLAGIIKTHGLHLSDWKGLDLHLNGSDLCYREEPDILKDADIILVCVKSSATDDVAKQIATYAPPTATIASFQNGVRNTQRLRTILPDHDIRGAMVSYNIIELANGHFHRGTSGKILVETGEPDLATLLGTDDLVIETTANIGNVQWGKLLLNLNNGLNALADRPLREQLQIASWRKRFASQWSEAMAVMKAEGIRPVSPAPVPASVVPFVLRLPTPIFKLIARQMLAIDPKARSSMWDDIKAGRETEIDEFQGEIIRLGEKHHIETPECNNVADQVRRLEKCS